MKQLEIIQKIKSLQKTITANSYLHGSFTSKNDPLYDEIDQLKTKLKSKTITSYSDPSHGWFKVSIAELNALQIIDQISCYSYIRGKFAYLEEDQDATIYIEALANVGLIQDKLKFNHHSTYTRRSKIRNYDYYDHTYAQNYINFYQL